MTQYRWPEIFFTLVIPCHCSESLFVFSVEHFQIFPCLSVDPNFPEPLIHLLNMICFKVYLAAFPRSILVLLPAYETVEENLFTNFWILIQLSLSFCSRSFLWKLLCTTVTRHRSSVSLLRKALEDTCHCSFLNRRITLLCIFLTTPNRFYIKF